MEYLIGAGLALAVGGFATVVGFDRGRVFYATVVIVVASYYDLFAVMAGSIHALGAEALVTCGFAAAAVAGFRWNPWLIVAALAGHGCLDFVHGGVIDNPGTPAWWPGFCMAYDILAAVYLGASLCLRGSETDTFHDGPPVTAAAAVQVK